MTVNNNTPPSHTPGENLPRWKIDPEKPSPVVPGEFSPVFLDPGENPF